MELILCLIWPELLLRELCLLLLLIELLLSYLWLCHWDILERLLKLLLWYTLILVKLRTRLLKLIDVLPLKKLLLFHILWGLNLLILLHHLLIVNWLLFVLLRDWIL